MRSSIPFLLAALACLGGGCGTLWQMPDPLSPHQLAELRVADDGGRTVPIRELLHAAKVTVLVFWAPDCPAALAYQRRIEDIAVRWRREGVQVLAIAVDAPNPPYSYVSVHTERVVAVPVWRDPGARLARALQVEAVPTAVVITPDGSVEYRGWVDNDRPLGDPERRPWLELAIVETVVGGRPLEIRPVWGCPLVPEARVAQP